MFIKNLLKSLKVASEGDGDCGVIMVVMVVIDSVGEEVTKVKDRF